MSKPTRLIKAAAVGTVISVGCWAPIANPTAGDSAAAATTLASPVLRWDDIAASTVVSSGTFPNEGLLYMAYVSSAVLDAATQVPAAVAGATPSTSAIRDAAVVEAAYRTLVHYFPEPRAVGTPDLDALHRSSLTAISGGPRAIVAGVAIGRRAAQGVIVDRTGDGRQTPIGVTSPFDPRPPGPGTWRLTPTSFAAPQTPWVADVRPFVLRSAGQFLPPPPPALDSAAWVSGYEQVRALGAADSSARTPAQTAVAQFWSANPILQYNGVLRDLAVAQSLDTTQAARLMAMVNIVAADAQISVMNAKYYYDFWRPVTAIDPSAVTADGFGPVPGYDDGNPATAEQSGWRPLLNTPSHPEYPAAHGSLTSAMAEVFSTFIGSSRINLDIQGFDPAGAAGNLDAVHHFDSAAELRREIVNARLWAGWHYPFSSQAGVTLGRQVARYDLSFGLASPLGPAG